MNFFERVADKFKGQNKEEEPVMVKNEKTTSTDELITNLRKQFSAALRENNNDEMVRTWNKIKELEQEEESKERLEVEMRDYKKEAEKEAAIEKINYFHEHIYPKHKAKANEAMKHINEAKEKYIDSLRTLNELNMDYYKSKEPYMMMCMRHGINVINESEEIGLLDGAWSSVNDRNIVSHPRALPITEYDINKRIRAMD